ncbi:aminotransferase class I/II-fold pyridoxal phosphate-dependent enzyme, partial [Rhodoferax sp.]|uniref:aminotransferase class I/II-fold pyridoxal phosphate-dependent enzyme n=1 Tax=Rhodoferax sp. TaxID=50421 RepID=UPI001A09833A
DCAYAPLRLAGTPSLNAAQLAQVWQLFSPNKALGLTGVRAAYVIAPPGAAAVVSALEALAPAWPVGAHGVAMLQAWVSPEVQTWLQASLRTLRDWKLSQTTLLTGFGWLLQPSQANFFCAKPPQPPNLAALRHGHGIKLRDATSFGLPGWYRLGVLGLGSQAALRLALSDRVVFTRDNGS